MRGTPAELDALVGQRVESIRRRGKFLLIDLDRDAIAVQPDADRSLPAGRARATSCRPRPRSCSASGRATADRPTRPRWTRGRRLAAGRRRARRGPLSRPDPDGQDLPPTGRRRPARRRARRARDQGPDADDPALTLEVWRERIRRHPGELKNLLRNQAFVAGIGNAYSDEILHAARLLPFRKRASLAAEEVDALYDATRSTLADAIDVLRERVPPTFEKQVRDFLAVHDKGGQPCPRCGTRITEVEPAASSPRTAGAASADRRGPGQGILRTWPIVRLVGSVMPLSVGDRLGRRPELGGDPDQRVAGLDLVGLRRRPPTRPDRDGPADRAAAGRGIQRLGSGAAGRGSCLRGRGSARRRRDRRSAGAVATAPPRRAAAGQARQDDRREGDARGGR